MTVEFLKTVIETSTAAAVSANPALVYLRPYNEVLATAVAAGVDAKTAAQDAVIAGLLERISALEAARG